MTLPQHIMSDLLLAVLSALGGLLSGLVGMYISLKNLKPNIKLLNSQEHQNLADAADTAAGALVQIIKAFSDERKALEMRIDELEKHREERTKRIDELEDHIEKLNREYTVQNAALHDEIKVLRNTVEEGQRRYGKLKRYTEKLLEALKLAGVEQLPEMEDERLSETWEKIRTVKRQ